MQRSRRITSILTCALAATAALVSVSSAASASVARPAGYVSDYETYTTVASTRLYAKPGGSKDNQFLYAINPKGSAVDITCWRYGSAVGGDRVWYYMFWMGSEYPVPGYGPGADVATGHDPNPRIKPC